MKYSACVIIGASVGGEVEADTPEDAAEKAYETFETPSICHHCSGVIEIGDAIGVIIYDENNNEVYDDTHLGTLQNRVDSQKKTIDDLTLKLSQADKESDASVQVMQHDAIRIEEADKRIYELEKKAQYIEPPLCYLQQKDRIAELTLQLDKAKHRINDLESQQLDKYTDQPPTKREK